MRMTLHFLTLSWVMLHNICAAHGDIYDSFLPQDEEGEPEEATVEKSAGKRHGDVLLYYATQKI